VTGAPHLLDQGAAAIAAAVSEGRATPAALLAESRARTTATHDGADGLNAVLAAADTAPDTARGALAGEPVVLKDNFATLTLPTTSGSKSLTGWVSPYE
jgi:Asp-tRNA(Asn)/Glu-tRNA(Gln) amidotransferase A subunit family amidase